jgi:hypothetical protein
MSLVTRSGLLVSVEGRRDWLVPLVPAGGRSGMVRRVEPWSVTR